MSDVPPVHVYHPSVVLSLSLPVIPGPASPLCQTFHRLSASTWATLADSDRYGIRFSEESISDHLMLELLRSHPGVVKIQQFNRREEARTGADWAWWFEGLGWLGMRVQAKRLEASSRRYEHLLYLSGKKRTRQVDLLRSAAKKDGLYPIYCFYNYWDTTAHPVASVPFHCQSFGPSEQVLGCTLAAADDVHSIVEAGKDDLSSVLDVSFPWVCLVCCPGTESARGLADRVRGALEMHRSDAPVRGEGSRRGRRRAAPTLVERPPTYVTDTLEDQRTAEPPTGLAGVVVFRDGARRSTTGR